MNMCRTHAVLFLFVLGVSRFCDCLEATTEYTTAFSDTTPSTSYTDYSFGVFTNSAEDYEYTSAAATEKSSICQTEEELRVTEPKITARSIVLSWQPLSVSTKCNVKYDINITKAIYDPKEIPYFRHESRTIHNFARLKECTAYNISVKPSSGKLFQTTLRTLPGKVPYLILSEFSGHTYAEWEEPLNPECNRYNITLGNQSFIQENTTSVDIGYTRDIRCTQLKITPLDTQNKTGETTTKTVPGQIQNLQVTPEEYTIKLTWEPPEDSSCVESYKIRVGDAEFGTTENEYTIKDLEACTTYKGTVSAISATDDEGAPSDFSVKTTTPSSPGKPGDPKFIQDGDVMNATWSPPDKMGACIKQYNIIIWDQNDQTQSYTTVEPFYVIERVVPCKVYNFQVIALIGVNQGPNVVATTTIADRATAAPTVFSVTPGKTTFDVIVQLEAPSSNMCNITDINIECQFSGDEFFEWMIKNSRAELAYNDSSARPRATVTVADLSEYTDYNCSVYVINSGGTSDGADFENRTLEEVPSPPQNLTWDEGENSVNISWNPPFKVPGVLGQYQISINHTKFLHYTACEVETVNITSEYIEETIFDFGDHVPNSEYAVSVAASTSAGYGQVVEEVFLTQPKASEKPREVTHSFENIMGDEYKVTVTITWILPCNTKGELIKFICILDGESTENGNEQNEVKEVPANEDISNHLYSATFPLQPLHNYTAKIYAVTKASDEGGEIQGETEELSFKSPDGFPSAPLNLEIVDISSRTAVFRWKEPANKNGELISYRIHVEVGGALHEVPAGCDHNRTNLELILDASETQHSFTGFPNYKYTVSMEAATSAGFGSRTEPITFQTEGDVPEPVRDIARDKDDANQEIYNVTLRVTFDPPCHTNGIFSRYEIELNGMRDDESYKMTRNITNFYETEATFQLKPEHEYSGYIMVHTDQFSANVSIPVDISPAGVPKTNNISLSELDVIDPFTANFVLMKDTFDESNGKILYYSIILSPFDESATTELFDFWQNGNWPESGFWSEDGELETYQTTPDRWNPFTDSNYRVVTSKTDKPSITFKIGTSDSCDGKSYCNGKLRPDTAYHLRVRGFTSRAYRDTVPVKFITPAKLNLGGLIGGIVGACAALAVIFIAAFIFWRRRKQKQVDEEDPLENPLVPVPIPIKAFVDHYNDYKTNLNKLKSEYTLLERKSAEQQLSTSFALTDDNKRKNRYINILPYDETRVKLDRDKNDNYTDYINASFVKGYSDNVEYIATQGPLEQTVVDFWRMVIQENVSLIVMVAQFVEQNKPKCHQYFPNNHETMDIGDGIEIRCANELPFDGYVKRTLLVQRELMQMTITHLQFTEWPDFGCPNDTDSMLEFCNVMRQIIEQHKSKTVIHCSAGVGRTGTLIAIDILIQTIENKGDIDVFKTVLDLRKQRIRMVQTEKQYMFIHSCLAQHIQNPKMPEKKLIDPIYENVTIKQENGGTAESAL